MAGWGNGTEDGSGKGQGINRERRGLSVEQKLELSHMLRQEQDHNRLQMDQREMLVYGAKSKKRRENRHADAGLRSGYGRTSMLRAAQQEEDRQEQEWQKMQKRNRISFVIRGFLSVLLFMIVLLMKFAGLKIGSVDYQNLIESVGSEEFINGIDFEELIPYTDKEQVPQGTPSAEDGEAAGSGGKSDGEGDKVE